MKAKDWSVFAPVEVKVRTLMKDGKTRSVTDVRTALSLESDAHTRKILYRLTKAGELTESLAKPGRHAIVVFTATAGTGNGRKRVPALGR